MPFYFDSLATIVRLAGMQEVFEKDTLTFFAPTDRSILYLIQTLNTNLFRQGYDTVKALSDIPQSIWQKYLQRYMFHGANQLKDYPQIDFSLRSIYPGQDYLSWNNTPMNIGVVYNDDNGVKYVGYRQLTIGRTERIAASLPEHLAIIEALEERNTELAEKRARDHTLGLAAFVEAHGQELVQAKLA